MALLAAETAEELQKGESTLLDSEGLNSLQVSTTMRNCGLCPNNCMLTINVPPVVKVQVRKAYLSYKP